jgi:hypothetical protein
VLLAFVSSPGFPRLHLLALLACPAHIALFGIAGAPFLYLPEECNGVAYLSGPLMLAGAQLEACNVTRRPSQYCRRPILL